MRDEIIIVVNDEEDEKVLLAQRAVSLLEERKFACALLSPCSQLSAILDERDPKILVLDYFLAEAGTAIDLIASRQKPSETIFWTDEESFSVAVTALRLGIRDYILLHEDQQCLKLLAAITSIYRNSSEINKEHSQHQFIAKSETMQKSQSLLDSASENASPFLILHGARGSGRSTFAKEYHHKRRFHGAFEEIDARYLNDTLEKAVGDVSSMGENATLLIDNFDAEIDETKRLLSTKHFLDSSVRIVLGTTCKRAASHIAQLLSAQVVYAPSLDQRTLDIPYLVAHFAGNKGDSMKTLTDKALSLDWPGNVKELRACVELACVKKGEERLITFLRAKLTWEQYNIAEGDL